MVTAYWVFLAISFVIAYFSIGVALSDVSPPYREYSSRQKKVAFWVAIPSFFCVFFAILIGLCYILAVAFQKTTG